MVCVGTEEGAEEAEEQAEERRRRRDTESKARTPHKDVGKNNKNCCAKPYGLEHSF